MRGPVPEPTLAEFKPEIDEAMALEFGPMTSRKAVTAEAGLVPAWRVRGAIRKFLVKQADIKKREKEKTRVRQRDVDNERFRRIVDGRPSAGTA